ncbi:MAG: NTP transferase domain-containing protein [Candidatus Aenigmarchaeota archaeon]|nr:NTP transferase domain-containing protein [Candidatus Aenigmarchaeota archaeon]
MKEKISITLDTSLLSKVDNLIDGINIRNRSQAIEYLLRKALGQREVNHAIILAGGDIKELKYGNTYKPLVKVNGKILILNTIQKLKEAGVKNVIIAAGPITDKIFEVVGDGSEYGLRVTYIKDEGLGTAGVIKKSERYLNTPFFVVFGDEYFDFDLSKMVEFHQSNKALVTMAISVTSLNHSKDAVKLIGNKVVEFKYPAKNEKTYHVNAGVYLMEPDVLSRIPNKGSLERTILPKLAKEGKLFGFVFSGEWKHIG